MDAARSTNIVVATIALVVGVAVGGGTMWAVAQGDKARASQATLAWAEVASDDFDALNEALEACRDVLDVYGSVISQLGQANLDQRDAVDTFFTRGDWWAGNPDRLYALLGAADDDVSQALGDANALSFELDTCYGT